MSRLTWGAAGDRLYQAGVDRGVLYVENKDGVPWSGLVSVTDNTVGGELTPFYYDGIEYMTTVDVETYKATITAFYSPIEFDECEGVSAIHSGFYATAQKRTPFGFSYRTQVGNDDSGVDYGYKIHIIYNAIAEPSKPTHQTMTRDSSLDNLSWVITTKPVYILNGNPTAHFIIDTRNVSQYKIAAVEDILYGNDYYAARLPSFESISDLLQ